MTKQMRDVAWTLQAEFGGYTATNAAVDALIEGAARIDELEASLQDALDGLYNGFEPDNQSNVYKRVKAVLERRPTQAKVDP